MDHFPCSKGVLACSSLALAMGVSSLSAQAGLVTGIENNVSIFTLNFNNSFDLGTSTDGKIWQGTYREDAEHFALDMYSGPDVDFNNWDNDFDTYKLNIESLWTVKLTVSIRDNALFSDEDVFRLDGSLQHTAGENLPHKHDSAKGEFLSIGFSDVKVIDLKPADLVDVSKLNDPLLGGVKGSYWTYHVTQTVDHDHVGHKDTYNVYFLANVDTETNAQSGYRLLISGVHAVPEPQAWALLLAGVGVVGWLRTQKKA